MEMGNYSGETMYELFLIKVGVLILALRLTEYQNVFVQ